MPLIFSVGATSEPVIDPEMFKKIHVSKATTVEGLKEQIAEAFGLSPNVDSRLWSYQSGSW